MVLLHFTHGSIQWFLQLAFIMLSIQVIVVKLLIIFVDMYRGPYAEEEPERASERYAWDVKNLIEHSTSGQVAGFIAETIQVCLYEI
jgi:adenosylmethionine-8-amino-7-oxononanoate aminotransferase